MRASSETFQIGTGVARKRGNSPGMATKTGRKAVIASGVHTRVFRDDTQTLGRLTPVTWAHLASIEMTALNRTHTLKINMALPVTVDGAYLYQ